MVATGANLAEGKSKRRKARKSRKAKKKDTPKTNAPRGWTWPASDAMKRQGDECLIRLDERGVKFTTGRSTDRITTPVVVEDMMFGGVLLEPRFRKPPFAMDCHLALAFARIGPRLRELGVAKLRFSTIHELRKARVNGTTKNSLSRHSYGLAIDIFELVTDDGTLWTVETDFTAGDSVLHEVDRDARRSGKFRRILSPQNDPTSHADHFHMEANVPRLKLTATEREVRRRQKRAKRQRARRAKRKRKRRRKEK